MDGVMLNLVKALLDIVIILMLLNHFLLNKSMLAAGAIQRPWSAFFMSVVSN
jgi:hypothetical protein